MYKRIITLSEKKSMYISIFFYKSGKNENVCLIKRKSFLPLPKGAEKLYLFFYRVSYILVNTRTNVDRGIENT